MSTIATATVLPISALTEIQEAATPRRSLFGARKDNFPAVMSRRGRELETFSYSGYVLATLLSYLDEVKGIDLTRSSQDAAANALTAARGSSHLILAPEQRSLAQKLVPELYVASELRTYFNEFNQAGEGEEVGEAMLEGIRFLRRAVEAVTPDAVVLLSIG